MEKTLFERTNLTFTILWISSRVIISVSVKFVYYIFRINEEVVISRDLWENVTNREEKDGEGALGSGKLQNFKFLQDSKFLIQIEEIFKSNDSTKSKFKEYIIHDNLYSNRNTCVSFIFSSMAKRKKKILILFWKNIVNLSNNNRSEWRFVFVERESFDQHGSREEKQRGEFKRRRLDDACIAYVIDAANVKLDGTDSSGENWKTKSSRERWSSRVGWPISRGKEKEHFVKKNGFNGQSK